MTDPTKLPNLRTQHYRLIDKLAVPCTLLEWAEAFEKNRRVAITDVGDLFQVSTVFLGLDHSFSEADPPLIFETMVFDLHPHDANFLGKRRPVREDHYQDRYSTWNEALAGHSKAVEWAKAKVEKARQMIGL